MSASMPATYTHRITGGKSRLLFNYKSVANPWKDHHNSSELHRGLNNTFDTNMKLFVTLAGLLAAAQAEAFYGYGYGLHQQNWPTAYGPGFERTIWGARGKRDADADAYGLGLGSGGFIRQSRPGLPQFGIHHNGVGAFGHLVGKRSADAFGYGYAPFRALGGAGLHPTGVSYSNRSPQGAYGKRDAEAHYGYGYAPLIGRGVAIHPGFATSYTQRSPQGLHKRDAEALGLGAGGFIRQSRPYAAFGIHHNGYGAFAHPVGKRSADAWGYGYAPFYGRALGGAGLHPTGVSYSNRSPQGLHKRDADAEAFGYGYAPVLAKGYPSWPGVVAPGFESTCYGCGLGKRSADADAAYYTQRSPQGAYGLGYGRGYYWG